MSTVFQVNYEGSLIESVNEPKADSVWLTNGSVFSIHCRRRFCMVCDMAGKSLVVEAMNNGSLLRL
jgi:hypothetical protein